jgi:PLP dependent protein
MNEGLFEKIRAAAAKNGASLVVVSKTQPVERIRAYYTAGQRIFGENRVQELVSKQAELPEDIAWHLIGHLQTNKVRQIAPFVSMIHAVDSLRLLEAIEKEAARLGRSIDCLLQFHIAREESKFGLDEEEAVDLLGSAAYARMTHVRICGVMGMASFTEDLEAVRGEFKQLKGIFERLKTRFFAENDVFREISMGMSGDWEIALEEGSTLLRVGSSLFTNERN